MHDRVARRNWLRASRLVAVVYRWGIHTRFSASVTAV
jgi:hypothetical protein